MNLEKTKRFKALVVNGTRERALRFIDSLGPLLPHFISMMKLNHLDSTYELAQCLHDILMKKLAPRRRMR